MVGGAVGDPKVGVHYFSTSQMPGRLVALSPGPLSLSWVIVACSASVGPDPRSPETRALPAESPQRPDLVPRPMSQKQVPGSSAWRCSACPAAWLCPTVILYWETEALAKWRNTAPSLAFPTSLHPARANTS